MYPHVHTPWLVATIRVLFSRFFCGSQSGNHPQEQRAKFGYRSDPQKRIVDNFSIPGTYVLATPKNPVSKHGDFHVFLLGMCRPKRNLVTIQKPKNLFCMDAKFCTKQFSGKEVIL